MVATGANAEFGRTAGGVVNVITKSGTNQVAREPVLLPAARGADVEHVRRQAAHRLPPRAVRRHGRRPDREGQGVLLRRLRGHPREPAARRTCRSRSGTPCPVSQPDARGQRGADQQQRRLPAPRAPRLLQDDPRPGRRAAGRRTRSTTTALLGKVDWSLEPAAATCRCSYNFNYSKNDEPDVRRRRPTAPPPTAPRGRRRSTSSTSNLFTHAHRQRS